ncbi:MAG: hypothetical protein AAB862_01185 [Patescibacteria group bacterium]
MGSNPIGRAKQTPRGVFVLLGRSRQTALPALGFEGRSDVLPAGKTASRGSEIFERRRENICDQIPSAAQNKTPKGVFTVLPAGAGRRFLITCCRFFVAPPYAV